MQRQAVSLRVPKGEIIGASFKAAAADCRQPMPRCLWDVLLRFWHAPTSRAFLLQSLASQTACTFHIQALEMDPRTAFPHHTACQHLTPCQVWSAPSPAHLRCTSAGGQTVLLPAGLGDLSFEDGLQSQFCISLQLENCQFMGPAAWQRGAPH